MASPGEAKGQAAVAERGEEGLRAHKASLDAFYRKHEAVGFWQEKYGPCLALFADRLAKRNAAILAQVPPRVGRALDLGCGLGDLLPPLARRSRLAVGCDLAESHILPARRNVAGCPGVALLVAPAERLPFRDGAFDCVILADVLEHVLDAASCLGEVHRVLCPGGRLIVTTPDKWVDLAFLVAENAILSPIRIFRWTKRGLRRLLGLGRPAGPAVPGRNLSRAEVERRLRGAGFTIRLHDRIEFYPGAEGGSAFAKFLKVVGRCPRLREDVVEPWCRRAFQAIERLKIFNLRQLVVAERAPLAPAPPGGPSRP